MIYNLITTLYYSFDNDILLRLVEEMFHQCVYSTISRPVWFDGDDIYDIIWSCIMAITNSDYGTSPRWGWIKVDEKLFNELKQSLEFLKEGVEDDE